MLENYRKEQELKTLIKRVEAHIRNSNDFKRVISLLLKEEEECLFYKDFNIEDPKGKRPLSELVLTDKDKFHEIEQKTIIVCSKFLKKTEDDYKEISFLQGVQREVRVKEFKKILFERLVSTSGISILMTEDYNKLFTKEMVKYYTLE